MLACIVAKTARCVKHRGNLLCADTILCAPSTSALRQRFVFFPLGLILFAGRSVSPLTDAPPTAASSSSSSHTAAGEPSFCLSPGRHPASHSPGRHPASHSPGHHLASSGGAACHDGHAAAQCFSVSLRVELQQLAGRPQPQVVWDCLVLEQLDG